MIDINYAPLLPQAGPELIINGNHDVFQRMAASTRTFPTSFNIDTSFCADRMFCVPAGATITGARSTTVPPNNLSQFSQLLNGFASVTTVPYGQRIRSAIVNTRAKQPLLFQAQVLFTGTGGPFTPNLIVGTPGAVDDFTTVTNRQTTVLGSCATGVWSKLSLVFNPSAFTNIANGMEAALQFPSGMLVSGNTVNVAQFSVKPANRVLAYTPPDPDQTLSDCQQYYWKTFAQNQPAVQNSGVAANALIMVSASTSNGVINIPVSFPRRMVKAPTMTAYCPYAANSNWGDGSVDSTKASLFLASGETNFTVYSSAAGVAGGSFNIHVSANAELS